MTVIKTSTMALANWERFLLHKTNSHKLTVNCLLGDFQSNAINKLCYHYNHILLLRCPLTIIILVCSSIKYKLNHCCSIELHILLKARSDSTFLCNWPR